MIGPARTETLSINIEFDRLKEKEKRTLRKLFFGGKRDSKLFGCRTDGDTATVIYTIDIEYFGGIVERLNYMLELINDRKVVNINTKELENGKCIIQELFVKMEQIERKYND